MGSFLMPFFLFVYFYRHYNINNNNIGGCKIEKDNYIPGWTNNVNFGNVITNILFN